MVPPSHDPGKQRSREFQKPAHYKHSVAVLRVIWSNDSVSRYEWPVRLSILLGFQSNSFPFQPLPRPSYSTHASHYTNQCYHIGEIKRLFGNTGSYVPNALGCSSIAKQIPSLPLVFLPVKSTPTCDQPHSEKKTIRFKLVFTWRRGTFWFELKI